MRLVSVDIETTGTDIVKDRVVQIGLCRLGEDGAALERHSRLINPGMSIPTEAFLVHGITDEMVKDQPRFKQIAWSLLEWLTGAAIVTFNGLRFDIPLLAEEFARCGIVWPESQTKVIDVRSLWTIYEPRTLAAAMSTYLANEAASDQHVEFHDAGFDAECALRVLQAQVRAHSLQDKTPDELAEMSLLDRRPVDPAGKFLRATDGQIVYGFGKHKDRPVDTERGYLRWMLDKGEGFPRRTLDVAQRLLNGEVF